MLVGIIATGSYFTFQSDVKTQICIEDWYADTSSLFQSASSFFSSSVTSAETKSEQDQLDTKLQELLPTTEIDLSFQSVQQETIISSITARSNDPLLPNLFIKDTPSPGTRFNGLVHTDKDDKVVGAEVNISIPTNIR
ncbi:MAG: hypothetical protein ACI843_000532 [Psychrobacter glaciei]|jgi:hypothetical protein